MLTLRAAVAACTLLATAVVAHLPTASSYADPARPDRSAAERALEVAKAALDGRARGVEPTIALLELFHARDGLEGEDREEAEQLLARPDGEGPGADWDHAWNPDQEAPPVCNARICVHYLAHGTHRATYSQAKAALKDVTTSYDTIVGTMRYRAPRKDGSRGNHPGLPRTRGKLDVYLANLGADGIYGYAAPEDDPAATSDGNPYTSTGYLVLDNDYEEFGCAPSACRRVTAAHELYHVVQYAFDNNENLWFMESTATWVEEQVFDAINDNRGYLETSPLTRPERTLDRVDSERGFLYGGWIFHEFLGQRLGRQVVRQAWYHAGKRGVGWRGGMKRALAANDADLSWAFTGFSGNNLFPKQAYSEGWTYPDEDTPLARASLPLLGGDPSGSASLDQLASASWRLAPTSTSESVLVTVEFPRRGGFAAFAIVEYADGRLTRHLVGLDSAGRAERTFPFAQGEVAHVHVTLANHGWADDQPASVSFRPAP